MLQTCCKGNTWLLQPHNVMRLQYLRNGIGMNSELLALTDAIKIGKQSLNALLADD